MIDEDIAIHLAYAYDEVTAPDALPQVLRRGNRLRRARRVRRAGTVIGAVSLTTVIAVSGLPTAGAPSAFASWTARPTIATADQTAQIVASCRTQLRQAKATDGWKLGPAGPVLASSPDVLDIRGKYAIALWDNGTGTSRCERWLDDGGRPRTGGGEPVGGSLNTTSPSKHRLPAAPGGAAFSIEEVTGTGSRKDRGLVVQGWLGADVTRVELTVPGRNIEASVNHGMFAAFWPVAAAPTDHFFFVPDVVKGTATAYDANDRVLAVVPFASPALGPMGFSDVH